MDSALHIVVVEDHDDLREVTVAALVAMGHEVRGVDCAEALDDELGDFRPELVVLDLNLPGEDGLSVARRLRKAEPNIGIIMVTARDQARDVTRGYDAGADIYVTKPAAPEQLGAAIQALARRLRPAPTGEIVLNLVTLQLRGPAASVDISDQECAQLMALARAPEHRLETWQLIQLSGKAPEELSKSTLEVQIARLRRKLELAGAPQPTIKAIRRSGYQLCFSLTIDRVEA